MKDICNEGLVADIARLFAEKGWTLASAESCTGGNIGHVLTLLPGCSSYYKGGVISYTNQVKHDVLGVSQQDLDAYGPVCQTVAEQMAVGACRVLGSDFAVSTTGIAGPSGATELDPVGTVWIAATDGHDVISRRFVFDGDRADVIEKATFSAFFLLKEFVNKNKKV